jgi:hypothetical protein
MLHDKLWELAERADWRLITPEDIGLAIVAFGVMVVLIRRRMGIWKRVEAIETQLSKMQNEVTTILQVQAALIRKQNANSKVEIDPRGVAIEITDGDIAGQSMSTPITSSQPESAKSAKLSGTSQ